MRVRLGWVLGAGAVAAVALRALGRRKPRATATAPAGVPDADPRAEELRRRLAESRAVVDEREAFEEGELPVDRADAAVDERRRSVHEHGRAAVEDMRGREPDAG